MNKIEIFYFTQNSRVLHGSMLIVYNIFQRGLKHMELSEIYLHYWVYTLHNESYLY